MNAVPLVEVVRNGFREGEHFGSVVVLAPDGSVLHAAGNVIAPIFPRSSNKPAQAVGMLRVGLELDDQADLALAAASHSGEDGHVDRVRAMLTRHDLTEDSLRCPADWPLSEAARDQYIAAGHGKQRITMNCSGKHAAMLATCTQRGWSTEGYLDPKHPLQVSIFDTVSELAEEPVAATAVDGCGAPLLAISLTGLARTFARLVTAAPGTPQRQVSDAMRARPWLVAGTDREDTALMAAVPGSLSKSGYEGVFAIALEDGHAVALKISDGSARARMPVVVAALRALGLGGEDLDALAELPLLGGGKPAGTVRALPGLFS